MLRREKKSKMPSKEQFENYIDHAMARYYFLMIKDLEFQARVRRKELRLSRKNMKETDKWVV